MCASPFSILFHLLIPERANPLVIPKNSGLDYNQSFQIHRQFARGAQLRDQLNRANAASTREKKEDGNIGKYYAPHGNAGRKTRNRAWKNKRRKKNRFIIAAWRSRSLYESVLFGWAR